MDSAVNVLIPWAPIVCQCMSFILPWAGSIVGVHVRVCENLRVQMAGRKHETSAV